MPLPTDPSLQAPSGFFVVVLIFRLFVCLFILQVEGLPNTFFFFLNQVSGTNRSTVSLISDFLVKMTVQEP